MDFPFTFFSQINSIKNVGKFMEMMLIKSFQNGISTGRKKRVKKMIKEIRREGI